jgi:citrate lyase subunit beta/citryl-CoA lyase
VVLPKAATAAEIRGLDGLLSYHEGKAGIAHGTVAILPLPETAQGMHDAHLLAKASARVRGIFGALSGPASGDIARAFGFRATDEGIEQIFLASKLVLDSRAAGAPYPIAGIVGNALDDLAMVERMIVRARDFGYTGVAVLHPSHVAVAHKVFRSTPSPPPRKPPWRRCATMAR